MRLLLCRNVMLAALTLGSGFSASADAGLIPWAYNSIFGPSPMYGYGYGAPGYSVGYAPAYTNSSYYSPAWSAYRAGYSPTFSSVSYGGFANYGYASPCAACGCNSCGCAGGDCASGNCGNCSSGNCANGNCASGNCGAGYVPDINNGPTPEPTRTTPANPPAANPPVENRNNPPVDDFTRVPARVNDSVIPPTTRPGTTIPGGTIPGGTIPNAIPDTNNNSAAPPFNEADGLFRTPTIERNPAPVEPANPGEVRPFGPNGTNLLPAPAPLNVDSVPVASVKIQRQRIVTQAGYRATPVSRLAISPRLSPEIELAHK